MLPPSCSYTSDMQALPPAPSRLQVQIRHPVPSDMPQLFAFLRQKASFDGDPDALRATEDGLASVLFSPAPPMHALVAEVDGELAGMATYHPIFSTFTMRPGMWLDDLFVQDRRRGQGIGRALLVQLTAIAKERGCARVDWLVDGANANGKQFYRRRGACISEQLQFCRLTEDAMTALTAGGDGAY